MAVSVRMLPLTYLAALMMGFIWLAQIYGDSIDVVEKLSDPDGRNGPPGAAHHRGQTPFPKTQILTSHGKAMAKQPNFLIIYTDDQGCGDVSTYGPRDCYTPHIDQIAHEGMLFTNMRANCTVCSPSRAALMTGKYADRVGVPGVIRTHRENSWGHLTTEAKTLPQCLSSGGYQTAIIGKWHLGLTSPNTPNERGFDFFHGFLGDMMDNYLTHLRHDNNYMRRNTLTIDPQGHATDLFTQWASDYLTQQANAPDHSPFFLYLAYNAPHFPIEPPSAWLDRVQRRAPEMSELRAKNVAFVEHLDDCIGKVLKTLDETGLASETLVVFTSDNGGSLPHAQSNYPWRDGKQSHYDGGLRVPFMVRMPGRIQPGSHSDYAGLVFDLYPTLLQLADVDLPSDLDAVSLLPLFEGRTIPTPRDLYFVRREGGAGYAGKSYEAIIRGDWKLLQNSPFQPRELYNLKEDPLETTDLSAKHPRILNELSVALSHQIQRAGSVPWQQAAATHD